MAKISGPAHSLCLEAPGTTWLIREWIFLLHKKADTTTIIQLERAFLPIYQCLSKLFNFSLLNGSVNMKHDLRAIGKEAVMDRFKE
jgi:hypothetical protein